MPRIPLVDLAAQHRALHAELSRCVESILSRSRFIGGEPVAGFEKEFARFCEAEVCVGCGNGTDALELILRAVRIGPGDEVITTPLTFIATAEAILGAGATPVFADVDPETGLLSMGRALEAVTARTRAIMPVHLYGQVFDVDRLVSSLAGASVEVIEDAAQAHGARLRGRRVGALGRAAGFSFFPGKNLGAWGDAGAVVTRDAVLAASIAALRDHGRSGDKYVHVAVGVNSRLDALHAEILRAKLAHLDRWNAARRQAAAAYSVRLAGVGDLRLPGAAEGTEPVYHLYVICSERRDVIRARLAASDIESGVHYPVPLHLQPALGFLGQGPGRFPAAERFAATCLSLPMFPEISESDIDRVCEVVRASFS